MALADENQGNRGPTPLALVDAIGLAVVVLIAVVMGFSLVGTTIQKSVELTGEQESLTGQLERLTELAHTLGEGEETLAMLGQGMEEIDRRLPANMNFQEFYSELTNLASEHYVVVSEMIPGEIQQEESYVSMPVTFSANAAFTSFHRFLFSLGSFGRLTKLDALTISDAGDEKRCEISMTIRIYAARGTLKEGKVPKKGMIPDKAQVPVAIVLGICFIALLIWQFGPRGPQTEGAPLLIATGDTEVEVSLEDLQRVLADIKAEQIQRVITGDAPEPVHRSPFGRMESRMSAGVQSMEPQELDEVERLEELRSSRDQRLSELKLSGTSILGRTAIALVNDRPVRAGDSVGGFTIIEIKTREIVLEDELGPASLQMTEVPTL